MLRRRGWSDFAASSSLHPRAYAHHLASHLIAYLELERQHTDQTLTLLQLRVGLIARD